MPRSNQALIALVVFSIVLAGCGGGTGAAEETVADEEPRYQMGEPLDDSTYAVVIASDYGGDTLTTAAFQGYLFNLSRQAGAIMDEAQRRLLRQRIAEDFVGQHLLLGEAERLGLVADSARVEEQINQIAAQNKMSRAMFEEAMTEQGMTIDSLRALIKEQMPLQLIQEQMVESAAEPTAEELEAFRQEQSEQVRAQHILFQTPESGQKDAVIAKAEAVLDSVKTDADFDAMARRHSEGPSAPQGGDLGYFSRRDMVAPFSEAAFALADSGDVAPELVETRFGYHIIRLLGRRTGTLIDSTQAHAMMMQDRQREAFEERYRALSQKAVIRVNPTIVDADLNARDQG